MGQRCPSVLGRGPHPALNGLQTIPRASWRACPLPSRCLATTAGRCRTSCRARAWPTPPRWPPRTASCCSTSPWRSARCRPAAGRHCSCWCSREPCAGVPARQCVCGRAALQCSIRCQLGQRASKEANPCAVRRACSRAWPFTVFQARGAGPGRRAHGGGQRGRRAGPHQPLRHVVNPHHHVGEAHAARRSACAPRAVPRSPALAVVVLVPVAAPLPRRSGKNKASCVRVLTLLRRCDSGHPIPGAGRGRGQHVHAGLRAAEAGEWWLFVGAVASHPPREIAAPVFSAPPCFC